MLISSLPQAYQELFLVFLLISCLKATIYKNDENLETLFLLNLEDYHLAETPGIRANIT